MHKSWLLCLILIPTTLFGDLNDDLNKFFSRAGASVNTSSAEIYKGQKAGYMTGGGVTIRNRVMSSKPVTINLPRFDAGCGGIDLHAGGFSFIDSDELVSTLKSIGSSSMGYAFMLGLETVSPQVSSIIKTMQTWANNANSLGIQSCEGAQLLLGATWPKRSRANEEVCRLLSAQGGRASTYLQGRRDCAQEDGRAEGLSKQLQTETTDRIIAEEMNVTWEALKKQDLIGISERMKELFMNLIGTIIYRKNKNFQIIRIPPKIEDETFLNVLMHGGEAEIKVCGDRKERGCLVLSEEREKISSSSAWVSRIRNTLLNIQEKVMRDEELSQEEMVLLSQTRFPLYRMINILTSYKHGYCPVEMYQVAEVVAMDLLIHFLHEVITTVRDGAYQLRNAKLYGSEIDEYLDDLQMVEQVVHRYETRAQQLSDREFQMMQKIQLIEEQIRSEIILH